MDNDDADGETKCSIGRREDVPGNVDPGSSLRQLHISERQRQLLLALALLSRHPAADDSSCVWCGTNIFEKINKYKSY